MNNVAENILKRSFENVKTNKTKIIPCNMNVVIEFYDDNPYRTIQTTENGLILGVESTHKYKSNETGEMEDSEEYIACAKVIAIGPDCKNVKVGDDVFAVKHIATPIPYRMLGYSVINEQNIICVIKNDD